MGGMGPASTGTGTGTGTGGGSGGTGGGVPAKGGCGCEAGATPGWGAWASVIALGLLAGARRRRAVRTPRVRGRALSPRRAPSGSVRRRCT
jgi:MYXO-CTERM domain-containing protein